MLAALIAAISDIMCYRAHAWMFLVKELPVKSNQYDPSRRNQRLLPVEAEAKADKTLLDITTYYTHVYSIIAKYL